MSPELVALLDEPWTLSEIKAEKCRISFEAFVREFWDEVPGAAPLQWNWHMTYLCEKLEEIAKRVFTGKPRKYDLCINISPGTSKSSIASVLFHPWTWANMPHAKHMTATHTENLAVVLADKAREVIRSEKYQLYYPEIVLRTDTDSKKNYANTLGGERQVFTIGGKSPTGHHFHFLGVDDPLDPQKAVSDAELQNARAFLTETLPSRRMPPDRRVAVVLLIMQRLHREDPSAVMLQKAAEEGGDPVFQVCLPAEKTEDIKPPELAAKYVDGLMDPKRLSKSILKSFQVSLGAYAYSGQFLQRPTPLGGGRFKQSYFTKTVAAAPYEARRVRSWDRAATANGGCATAGVLMARDNAGNFFVEHCVHGHWETEERNAVMLQTAQADRRRYGPNNEPTIWIEGEPGASGRDAIRGLVRHLAGFPVFEYNPQGKGDKDTRSEPWAAQLAAGNVYMVDDGSWDLNGYIQEHLLFKPEPGMKRGKLKDRVDASGQALATLMGAPNMDGPVLEMIKVGMGENKFLRIVIIGRPQLAGLIAEDTAILLNICQAKRKLKKRGKLTFVEPDLALPTHALSKLLDYRALSFADIQPQEYQDKWDMDIPEFGQKPGEVIMSREDGRYLWQFILKRRDPSPLMYFIVDDGGEDRRGLSVGYAICDALFLPRKKTIYQPGNPDTNNEGPAPNAHVYEMTKACREMVME